MSLEIKRYGNVLLGIRTGTQKGILKTVIDGTKEAKGLSPIDKGQLINSIGYSAEVAGVEKSGGYNNTAGDKSDKFLESKGRGLEGYYGTANEYAPYVEDGTRTMVAQPFMTPSGALLSGTKTANEVKKEMNETMQREVKKGTKATRIR